MQNYAFIIILFISNLVFLVFLKIIRKIGFLLISNKFNNPITITSAGVIIYINLLIIFLFIFYLKKILLKTYLIIFYLH